MSKGIILLADNLERFVNVRAEFLKRAGYSVLRAYSLEEAKSILDTQWLHLAILDIRLLDDSNQDDESGLELAHDPRYSRVAKMILTGFPSVDNIRDALTPRTQNTSRIVRFLSKKEGAEEMVKNVDQIFAEFIPINRALQIRWQNPSLVSIGHVAMLLQDSASLAGLEEQITELDDLLRMVLLQYDQLTISRILWQRDLQVALDVSLYAKESTTPAILNIARKRPRHQAGYHAGTMFPAELLQPLDRKESLHFVSSVWKLERGIDDAIPLHEFVQENSERRVISVLESLYHDILSPWYQGNLRLSDDSSLRVYCEALSWDSRELQPSLLHDTLGHLLPSAVTSKLLHSYEYADHHVTLHLTNGRTISLENPALPLLHPPAAGTLRMVHSPGGMEANTILVDRSGQVTLTNLDVQRFIPCELDFVSLEVDIRQYALEMGSLLSLYEFEKDLASSNTLTFSATAAGIDPECRKTMAVIQNIRRLADETFRVPFTNYLFGLWLISVRQLLGYTNTIKFSPKEITHYLHMLILAGLTASKLSKSIADLKHPPAPGIEIDDKNHQVFVNEQPVWLTPTEYELLHYLFERQDNLCRRSEIMRDVFKYDDADLDSERSLLNTHMGRLKAKIESDPSNPRYLITVRGQGYKLIPHPDD